MHRSALLAFGLLLSPAAVLSQTPSTDSQTLQSLLVEVRQLRQDLRTTTLAAQRAQILIYRVWTQEAVDRRLQERVDDNHSSLTHIQSQQKERAAALKEAEDSLEHAESPIVRKELEDSLLQLKARVEMGANHEQEAQTKLTEAEEQLRIEQAKLGRLQDELDRLDKALEDSSRSSVVKPQ